MEHLVNQPVANQGLHAEASQADDIVDLVQEIENLNKDDAIKRLLELEEQHEKTFFEIGGVCSCTKVLILALLWLDAISIQWSATPPRKIHVQIEPTVRRVELAPRHRSTATRDQGPTGKDRCPASPQAKRDPP